MPACVTRMMGPARGDTETASVHEKLLSLFEKAGYEVIYPEVPPAPLLARCAAGAQHGRRSNLCSAASSQAASRSPCCYWCPSRHTLPSIQ